MLEPYVQNLTVVDDLHVFRSVIVIYRCTLPVLSSVQSPFLIKVQQALLQSISRLSQKVREDAYDFHFEILTS